MADTNNNEMMKQIATEAIINFLDSGINANKINVYTYFMEEIFTDDETSEIRHNNIPYSIGYAYKDNDKKEFKKWETEYLENSNALIKLGENDDTKSLFISIDLETMRFKYDTYTEEQTLKTWETYYGIYGEDPDFIDENDIYDEHDYDVITPDDNTMKSIMETEEKNAKIDTLPKPTDAYLQKIDETMSYPKIVSDYVFSNKDIDNTWVQSFKETSETFKNKESTLNDEDNFSLEEGDESYKLFIRLSQELFRKAKSLNRDNEKDRLSYQDNEDNYNNEEDYNYLDDSDTELELDSNVIAFEFDADNSGGGANLYIVNADNEIIEHKDIELYNENWENTKSFELYLELRESMNEAWDGLVAVIDMDTMEFATKFYPSEKVSYLHNMNNVKDTIDTLLKEIA